MSFSLIYPFSWTNFYSGFRKVLDMISYNITMRKKKKSKNYDIKGYRILKLNDANFSLSLHFKKKCSASSRVSHPLIKSSTCKESSNRFTNPDRYQKIFQHGLSTFLQVKTAMMSLQTIPYQLSTQLTLVLQIFYLGQSY